MSGKLMISRFGWLKRTLKDAWLNFYIRIFYKENRFYTVHIIKHNIIFCCRITRNWYLVTAQNCQPCIFFIIQSLIFYHFRLEGVCSDWNVMFNISWTDPYMYVYVRACASKSRVIDCLSWPEVDRSVINISKDSETSKLDGN